MLGEREIKITCNHQINIQTAIVPSQSAWLCVFACAVMRCYSYVSLSSAGEITPMNRFVCLLLGNPAMKRWTTIYLIHTHIRSDFLPPVSLSWHPSPKRSPTLLSVSWILLSTRCLRITQEGYSSLACGALLVQDLVPLKSLCVRHVCAVFTSTCSLTTRHYYKDEASEKMLVNRQDFNDRLPVHGSESKLKVSITGYYTARVKTPTCTVETRNQPHKYTAKTHIYTKARANTNVFQMCVIVSVGWSRWRREAVIQHLRGRHDEA